MRIAFLPLIFIQIIIICKSCQGYLSPFIVYCEYTKRKRIKGEWGGQGWINTNTRKAGQSGQWKEDSLTSQSVKGHHRVLSSQLGCSLLSLIVVLGKNYIWPNGRNYSLFLFLTTRERNDLSLSCVSYSKRVWVVEWLTLSVWLTFLSQSGQSTSVDSFLLFSSPREGGLRSFLIFLFFWQQSSILHLILSCPSIFFLLTPNEKEWPYPTV